MAESMSAEQFAQIRGITVEAARRQLDVQSRGWRVSPAVNELLGDRYGEARIDEDGYLLFTVIDLSPADVDAINEIARESGIQHLVRVRRPEPDELIAWEQVRQELLRLRDTRSDVLIGYPRPDPGYRRPPFEIRLAAYAENLAGALHQQFGAYVEVYVGALPYPLPADPPALHRRPAQPVVDPTEIRIELDGPLAVRSGYSATHSLRVTNLTNTLLAVNTNGQLTAEIVDPRSGDVVGGYVGVQHQPGIRFSVPRDTAVSIPLLVGTASFVPKLGYVVPPGEWSLRTPLNLSDGRRLSTPLLAFTITD